MTQWVKEITAQACLPGFDPGNSQRKESPPEHCSLKSTITLCPLYAPSHTHTHTLIIYTKINVLNKL